MDGCMQYLCKAGIVIRSKLPCPNDHEIGSKTCDWIGSDSNDSCCSVCKGALVVVVFVVVGCSCGGVVVVGVGSGGVVAV